MALLKMVVILMLLAASKYGHAQDTSSDIYYNEDKPDNYKESNIKEHIIQNELHKFHKPLYPEDEVVQLEGDQDNCESTVKVFRPYAITINDTEYHVAQVDDIFIQRIKTVECNSINDVCFTSVFGKFDVNINAVCRQKFSTVSLYLFDPVTNGLVYLPVPIPVTCYCELSRKM